MITSFRNGSVDLKKVDELLEFQHSQGVQAICVCGTTGEASTMSDREQLDLIAHTVKRCDGRIRVIAGTGSNCTEHAVHKSRIAASMGADAVLCVTPYYNKADEGGLIAHYSLIAEAAEIPVILYNVPSRTGVDIPIPVYQALSKVPNIAGIKEASASITKAAQILAACGEDLTLWSGNDDMIVPMMALGAKGVISVLSNLCPAQTIAMTGACECGHYQTAGKLQCRAMSLIEALFSEVNPIPIKEAMNLAGFDVGEPRLPLCRMAEDKQKMLISALEDLRLIQPS